MTNETSESAIRRRAEAARRNWNPNWPTWAYPALQPLPVAKPRAVRGIGINDPVVGFAASMRGEPLPDEADLA